MYDVLKNLKITQYALLFLLAVVVINVFRTVDLMERVKNLEDQAVDAVNTEQVVDIIDEMGKQT